MATMSRLCLGIVAISIVIIIIVIVTVMILDTFGAAPIPVVIAALDPFVTDVSVEAIVVVALGNRAPTSW